jgi:hypothetical protein
VADLATVVAQLQGEQVEQAELARLLSELEELSEDDVKSLLSA